MKANKAPEKIWMSDDTEAIWVTNPYSTRFIEYTRTDAFIEKACEYWYQYNRDIVKRHGAKAVLGCGEFTVHVEDFRRYLEESKIWQNT